MRREIDELFGDVWARAGFPRASAPASARGSTSTTAATRRMAVVKAELAGVDVDDVQPRGARAHADHQRRAHAARHRGPRLPADRDRARALPRARSSSAPTSTPSRRAPPTRTASCASSCPSLRRRRAARRCRSRVRRGRRRGRAVMIEIVHEPRTRPGVDAPGLVDEPAGRAAGAAAAGRPSPSRTR